MSESHTSKVTTARRPHLCTECGFRRVAVGERYLRLTMPPWHDMNDAGKYVTHRACLRCAGRYGMLCSETRKQLTAAELAATPEMGNRLWEDCR